MGYFTNYSAENHGFFTIFEVSISEGVFFPAADTKKPGTGGGIGLSRYFRSKNQRSPVRFGMVTSTPAISSAPAASQLRSCSAEVSVYTSSGRRPFSCRVNLRPAAMAGNGFFNEPFDTAWHYQTAPWRDAPQFILCLKVNGRTALISDDSWKASREHSPVIYSHLRSGEYYDARKADDAWLTEGYDDSDWDPVFCRPIPEGADLRPIGCQPVREAEIIKPVSVRKTDAGWLADFGVTISGYMEITVQEPRGQEILFRYTEDLDEKLQPKYNGMDTPYFYPESPSI